MSGVEAVLNINHMGLRKVSLERMLSCNRIANKKKPANLRINKMLIIWDYVKFTNQCWLVVIETYIREKPVYGSTKN
jgi:hypothetical protein